jgi:hypothetical protein
MDPSAHSLANRQLLTNESTFAESEEANMYSLPRTNISDDEAEGNFIYPTIATSSDSKYFEFAWPALPLFFDFASTRFTCNLYITKADGSSLSIDASAEPAVAATSTTLATPAKQASVASDVAPINYIAATMWKRILVQTNQQTLYDSGSHYPYIKYLTAMLYATAQAKAGPMENSIYTDEDVGLTMSIGTDPGYRKRKAMFAGSQQVYASFPLFENAFEIKKVLPNFMEIRFSLERCDDAFCLMAFDGGKYKLCIENPRIKIRKVSLMPGLTNALSSAFTHSPFAYPFNRLVCKQTVLDKNQSMCNFLVHTSVCPGRIFFFMVNYSSTTNTMHENPFLMRNNDLQQVNIYAGGRRFPTEDWGHLNFDKHLAFQAYETMLETIGQNHQFATCTLKRKDWEEGKTVLAIDLSPGNSRSRNPDLFSPVRKGATQISLVFEKPLSQSIALFVVSEFQSIIKIDHNRILTSTDDFS